MTLVTESNTSSTNSSKSRIRRFLDANIRASGRIDARLNPDHGRVERTFLDTVRREMKDLPEGATVQISVAGGVAGLSTTCPRIEA